MNKYINQLHNSTGFFPKKKLKVNNIFKIKETVFVSYDLT